MNDPLNPITPEEQEQFTPLTPADAPKSQWRRWHLPVLALLAIASVIIVTRHRAPAPYQQDRGAVFGTFYNITYQSRDTLQHDIRAALQQVDASLSMFNAQSTLSRMNRGEAVQADSLFRHIFQLAQQVSDATDGAFDITVAPLVNAWGFGFKSGDMPTPQQVDSIRCFVGYQKVTLTDGQGHPAGQHAKGQALRIAKSDPRVSALIDNYESILYSHMPAMYYCYLMQADPNYAE